MTPQLFIDRYLWPKQGGFLAIAPALVLVLVPLLFALLLIAVTDVPAARYREVATLLIKFSAKGIIYVIAVGLVLGLVRHFFFKKPFEPLGITLVWYAAGAAIAGLTVSAFGMFKQKILPLNGFPWDVPLATLDRLLFLGQDPWRLTHAFLGDVQTTIAIDFLYGKVWMVLMYGLPVFAVMLFADRALRARIIGSWIASWVFIGGIAAWLLASAGPCYYTHFIGPNEGFSALNVQLAGLLEEARGMGSNINAIEFQSMLLAAYGNPSYAPAGGISAMPSMHLAMATLFALTGFQFHRLLGFLLSLFWLIIWAGSIHLGWHYATDGIVALLMMLFLWRYSQIWTARVQKWAKAFIAAKDSAR